MCGRGGAYGLKSVPFKQKKRVRKLQMRFHSGAMGAEYYAGIRMKFVWVLLLFCCSAPGVFGQDAHAAASEKTPVVASEQEEFQKVEDRWSDAVTKRDQYGLELVMAPQLVDIAASGDVTNRNQQIVALFKKDSGVVSLEQKVVSVRFLADGAVAVVNGTYVLRVKAVGGKKDEKGIFTHVFARVRTNWLCVSSQRTLVAEQAVGKAKAPGSKAAELPLKIPLIHDGAPKQ